MRLPVSHILPLAALVLLTSCGGTEPPRATVAPVPVNGPAADYPVVIGEAFTIDGTTYTPVDKMNYDAVGRASVGADGGNGVTVAHKTLPLPSYVEVTELSTGKTILARVERRGPMVNDRLIELSPGAAAQIGVESAGNAPVRVRRVNPPEVERALLRSGQQAPQRMDTPKGLLNVLMRKLDATATPAIAAPAPQPSPTASAVPSPAPSAAPSAAPRLTAAPAPRPSATPASRPTPTPTVAPSPRPTASAAPAPAPARGGLVVQAAAFSTQERADTAARALGGSVQQSGNFWRVRMGPFANRAQADAALAKARRAGYRDARIQRAD